MKKFFDEIYLQDLPTNLTEGLTEEDYQGMYLNFRAWILSKAKGKLEPRLLSWAMEEISSQILGLNIDEENHRSFKRESRQFIVDKQKYYECCVATTLAIEAAIKSTELAIYLAHGHSLDLQFDADDSLHELKMCLKKCEERCEEADLVRCLSQIVLNEKDHCEFNFTCDIRREEIQDKVNRLFTKHHLGQLY